VNFPVQDIAYAVGVLALVALVLSAWSLAGVGRVARRLRRVLRGSRESLEESLAAAQETAAAAQAKAEALEERIRALEVGMEAALSQVGVVRFNPFSDTGSDLSFAVALLNQKTSGVVFTGLWGRDEVRVYAKEIIRGDSVHPLSQEERQALELARRQKHRD
jgi:hypothetical protein